MLRRPGRNIRRFILTLSLALASVGAASERAMVRIACPLDGTTFEAMQEFSGYAEGQRLDLKKLGPISQPPPLARCPHCGLPIFSRYPDAALIERLHAIVASERFRTEALPAPPWFALGVLREELKADAFEIGWTYLQATWEAEEDGHNYARAAERALSWFERAATTLRDQRERRRDAFIARYLGVELSRRLGRFDEALRRLDQLGSPPEAPPWFEAFRRAQARLIAAHDAAPGDERPRVPLPPPR